MKILVISDSHDNVANLEKVLKWANKNNIEALIHAGDLSAPGVLKNTLAPGFTKDIYIINGNVSDPELLAKISLDFSNVKYLGGEGEAEIDGRKIYITHFPPRAQAIAGASVYDLVVFGHTHKSETSQSGSTKLINPGSVGGLYNPATFATYDTQNGEVKIFEVNKI
ncbi:MAG: YfcE family phosphodiesterase [Candidatus Magasanikbacteria bacterium]